MRVYAKRSASTPAKANVSVYNGTATDPKYDGEHAWMIIALVNSCMDIMPPSTRALTGTLVVH